MKLCRRGHAITDGNVVEYYNKRVKKLYAFCRICMRASSAKYLRSKKPWQRAASKANIRRWTAERRAAGHAVERMCSTCKLVLPASHFKKAPRYAGGLLPHCRTCYTLRFGKQYNQTRRLWYAANKEDVNARRRLKYTLRISTRKADERTATAKSAPERGAERQRAPRKHTLCEVFYHLPWTKVEAPMSIRLTAHIPTILPCFGDDGGPTRESRSLRTLPHTQGNCQLAPQVCA